MTAQDQQDRWKKKMYQWEQSGDRAPRWTPNRGRNQIRIIPAFSDGGDFFKEYQAAFKVGPNQKMVVPRAQYGLGDTPFQTYYDALVASDDPAKQEEASRIKPGVQVIVFVIDRADEAKGPQIWYATERQMRDVMKYVVDPRYGDITTAVPNQDGRGARDLIIDFTPKGQSGNRYAKYEILPDAGPSNLGTDEQTAEWLAVDLFEKYKVGRPSDAEYIEAVLNGTDGEFVAAQRSGEADGNPRPQHPVSSPPLAPPSPGAPAPPVPAGPVLVFPAGVSADQLLWVIEAPGQQPVQKPAAEIVQTLATGTDWTVHHGNAWKPASEHGFSVAVPPSTPPTAPPASSPPMAPPAPVPPSEEDAIQAQIEELQRRKAAQGQVPEDGKPESSSAAQELRQTLGG